MVTLGHLVGMMVVVVVAVHMVLMAVVVTCSGSRVVSNGLSALNYNIYGFNISELQQ